MLSPSETGRASRFVYERHKRRSIVARGALRCLLGLYTGQEPQTLEIEATEYGKPFLSPRFNLEFNLSHSEDLAIFAFARSTLGIDVETIRPMPDALLIAESHFSPDELAILARNHAAERDSVFFRCWTRKEAFIKGHGQGLYLPLKSFSVSLDPDRPALLRFDSDPLAVTRWNLTNIQTQNGHTGALAVEGPISELKQFEWTHTGNTTTFGPA
jgi:4'-phosphopantetheinyl transferase